MIYKLSKEGENQMAIRFSEFEDIQTVLNMKNKVKWVWIDCFTQNPLTKENYNRLKEAGFKLCFVSPELQNQPEKIKEYRDFFKKENIILDMICTKSYNIEKWKKDVQIIIPMSGLGKRFIDAGYKDPKPLIDVDGKPMIEHVIKLFPGESDFSFICNDQHLRETNMKTILQNICPIGKIYEVPVIFREGPVHAVSLIFDSIDDNKEVIVSYCDYGTYWNYESFLKDIRERNADGAIACYRGFQQHMLGTDNYAFLQETEVGSRWMNAIQEKKPFTENRMNEYASNGTYYFKTGAIMKKYFKELMEQKMKINNEYYVSMVYNLLVKDNLNVSIFEIEHMLQWGTPNDLEIYKGWSSYFMDTATQEDIPDKYDTTLILPMAGAGNRFAVKGYNKPKPLLDVCNKPMIIQAVNCLPDTTNKVFICLEDHIKNYNIESILQETYTGCTVISLDQITQGQACTTEIGLQKRETYSDKPILISACDNGVYYNKARYQKLLDDSTIDVIVWSFRNNPASKNNPNMYAWMETDEYDNILSVSCKKFDPSIHDIKNSHVIIGTMFFRKASFFTDGLRKNYQDNIRSNNEFYVDDVINQNIKAGLNVKVFEVDHYICWGTPDDYESFLYWKSYFGKCYNNTY
jgi:bifunctional N-acetylglucosamine-1-phosphate-uridyltransferase/glucosamine-1-phosphate-acetyltransferase GlmU-like protein